MTGRSRAIVLGFNQFGSVSHIARLLSEFGYTSITGLVNRSDLVDITEAPSGLQLISVPGILDSTELGRVAMECGAKDPATPFICAVDRPMLSYLAAWRQLGAAEADPRRIPASGMIRARVKPFARELWNQTGLDDTRWGVCCTSHPRVDCLTSIGTLSDVAMDREYIVKPVAGMASEAVKVCPGRQVEQCVGEVRQFLGEQKARLFPSGSNPDATKVCTDIAGKRRVYDIFEDVLIEEKIEGNEYTVDGYVRNGEVSVCVQQKEYRVVSPFFGDGLIVSPPANSIGPMKHEFPRVAASGVCHTSMVDFEALLEHGLKTLELDNWVFHAEVIETPDRGLRFVELNPRPPGGLLSLTAEKHLGQSPFEILLKMHLGLSVPTRRPGWVTGQFPIYAQRLGTISHINGVQEARRIEGVVRIVQVARVGDQITSLERENYLAFVCIYAPTHDEVRCIADRVTKMIDIG